LRVHGAQTFRSLQSYYETIINILYHLLIIFYRYTNCYPNEMLGVIKNIGDD